MARQIQYENRIIQLETERREKDEEIDRLMTQLESLKVCVGVASRYVGGA